MRIRLNAIDRCPLLEYDPRGSVAFVRINGSDFNLKIDGSADVEHRIGGITRDCDQGMGRERHRGIGVLRRIACDSHRAEFDYR